MKYRNEKYYSDHQNEVSHEDFYPAQVFKWTKGRYNRASEAVEAGIVETKDRFLRAAPLAALIAVDELKVWENENPQYRERDEKWVVESVNPDRDDVLEYKCSKNNQ